MRKVIGRMVLACLLAASPLAAQEDDGATTQTAADKVVQIKELIQEGKLEDANKLFESAELDQRNAANIRSELISSFVRKGNLAAAYSLAKSDVVQSLEGPNGPSLSSLQMMVSLAPRAQQIEATGELIDKVLTNAKQDVQDDGYSIALQREFAVASIKSRFLMSTGDKEQAADLNSEYLQRAKSLLEEQPESTDAISLVISSTMTSMQTASPAERESLFNDARELLVQRMSAATPDQATVGQYASLMYQQISSTYRGDPEAAETMLEETKEKLSAAAEADESNKAITAQYMRMLSTVESRLESAKKLAQLVGSPAPAIDAMYVVNGKDKSVDILDGKVLLLDFWAVWCGPCIATFPHLREWNEEFGPKGLQIVGVTRKYNYQWNEDTNRASRADGEVSDEEEIAMLEKFLAHHELQHPTIITPENSEMQSNYAVSGIPHAVLIDRKGIIRMVKVGSGEANANALHDMIVELLAE